MQSTILDETYCRIILGDMGETWLGNTVSWFAYLWENMASLLI
jgi:hypothetical protein